MGSCLVYNTTANSSGVALTKGAQSLTFVNISNVFNIPAGTGYCVSGTGTHAYAYGTFLANTKYQNTLINAPLTVTPTLSP
jgi:pantoate kinase